MKVMRWLASVLGWTPTVILVALVTVGGIVVTTHALDVVWLDVLVAVMQAIALPSLVALAWSQERSQLAVYEKSSGISRSEEEAEFRAAEAYDAKWQIEERERNREFGTGPRL